MKNLSIDGRLVWNSTPVGDWKGLKFVAEEDGSTIGMMKSGNPPNIDLVYSTDNGESWNDFIPGNTTVTLPNIGDEMFVRARTTNDMISSDINTDY